MKLPRFKFNKNILFVLILGLVVAFGAGLGIFTRKQRETAPTRSLSALKNNLGQVILASESLRLIDGTADTSPNAIESTKSALKSSLAESRALLTLHTDELGNEYQSLSDALAKLEKSYETLEITHKILGKAIAYNPSLDLGELNASQNKELIGTRAQAAFDNLDRLVESYKDNFSDEAYENLVNTTDCFGELADIAKGKITGNLSVVRQRCVSNYSLTRKFLVTELVQEYDVQPLSALNVDF